MLYICRFILIIALLNGVIATLSQSDRSKTKTTKFKVKSGPQATSVLQRGLVVSEPFAKDIIQEHTTYFEEVEKRNFNGLVLGYVTPWNNHGYDVAKNFTKKFTHISPVWLQIKRRGTNKYEVTGTHDIDKKWLEDLRKKNKHIRVDVRLFFDGWTIQDFTALFEQISEQKALAKAAVDVCLAYGLNGIVLELWSQVGGSVRSEILHKFIRLVSKTLRTENLELVLVIPPMRGNDRDPFTSSDFDALYDSVDAFSLMTYDYSNPQRPGPNGPIKWVRHCVQYIEPEDRDRRSKILLGLNFFGNSYTGAGGGPILGRDMIQLLKNYKEKIKFDDDSMENFFEVRSGSGKQLVFFPTLYSINQRIKLAAELGTGISIWEIGQGLDYFYDLL